MVNYYYNNTKSHFIRQYLCFVEFNYSFKYLEQTEGKSLKKRKQLGAATSIRLIMPFLILNCLLILFELDLRQYKQGVESKLTVDVSVWFKHY